MLRVHSTPVPFQAYTITMLERNGSTDAHWFIDNYYYYSGL
jgi:hypothetical protein